MNQLLVTKWLHSSFKRNYLMHKSKPPKNFFEKNFLTSQEIIANLQLFSYFIHRSLEATSR